MSLLPLILLSSLLLLIILKWMKNRNRKKGNFPPSPPKLPIIGNLHQLGKLPHKSLWHLSQLYGPIISLNLGGIQTIIISSADAARGFLKTHDLQTCSRPQTESARKLTHDFHDIAFSPYGDYWREVRKVCVLELFSLKRLKSYQPIIEHEMNSLIESISESASCGDVVDLTEKSMAFTAAIIFRIAFGKKVCKGDGFHEVVNEAEALLGSYSAYELFPNLVGKAIEWFSGYQKRLNKVYNELNSLFQEVIDEHLCVGRDHEAKEDDIIDVLLGLGEKQDQSASSNLSITHDHIKGILLNIFLGGLDTSSITIVWAMAELAKKPKLMKKAQQEIRSHMKNNRGNITDKEIEQCQYLKMIVKETLRLHPPAPLLLPRQVMSHFEMEGFDFYPKMMVQINAWAIARDPKCWKDPEEFIPERFAGSCIDFRGQHFELLPFGAGRRICPAINLGIKNVEVALANLLYHFDWKLPEGMKEEDLDMEESLGFSLTIYKKLPLKLVPLPYIP
ncbi:cytochrome P450 71B19-like [Cucumis melo var. makuwa]|uniref:Cytochrome P450 71B19-like n=2 Tax=Cucumis melo TaxID=3656 RepID=A0A5D3CZQ9_CUCMM|nr:cytochrome P450 71B19-like [Cucumis melo var. makuwa]TYK15669.1 cytochrome P450 71B19-like [Cucumis melo var. makuwa]